jgi:hypothetical protein
MAGSPERASPREEAIFVLFLPWSVFWTLNPNVEFEQVPCAVQIGLTISWAATRVVPTRLNTP